MNDQINHIKSLEAQVTRFQKERGEIYELLASKGIRRVSLVAAVRSLLKRMENARKLLK